MSNIFDGDAIAKADRDLLEDLGDHPLPQHPLYGASCPPQPDFGDPRQDDTAAAAARKEAFEKAVEWLIVNFAFHDNAFGGKGGIISLVNGKIITMANLRDRMAPWTYYEVGPKNGIKRHSPADAWRTSNKRASIQQDEMRPDQRRPTFIDEDGNKVFNRYRPPVHPATGGDLATFESFLAQLFPDDSERSWFWCWLAHKTRRPWVPMVGVIMMAEEFGSGRGTLFDILEALFGKDYVVPCSFGELTGTSSTARFNARLADALIAVVNEAIAEDSSQQAQRRLQYETLKNVIEPSPTARQRYEGKWQHAFAQRTARSTIIATNHRDIIKLPANDRRLGVLSCGRRMTAEETASIRAWMTDPANIGALHRALLSAAAVPLEAFDPFGQPPAFGGRREMVGMARSEIEDAYDTAMDLLAGAGCTLWTMTQAQKLVTYIAGTQVGGDPSRARHAVTKNAYRLRQRDEANNRIRYRRRLEVIYAGSRAEQQRWHDADTRMIMAALDRTEAQITKVINADGDPLADLMRRRPEADPSSPKDVV